MTLREILDICYVFDQPLEYSYKRGNYALEILQSLVVAGDTISELKKTSAKKFLEHPAVKQYIKTISGGSIDTESIENHLKKGTKKFYTSLSYWLGEQTTRQQYNLVLHLHFDIDHILNYYSLIPFYHNNPFVEKKHPHSQALPTMAWSRIDLNFETGEALIEEVQSDWFKKLKAKKHEYFSREQQTKINRDKQEKPECQNEEKKSFEKYFEEAVRYAPYWDELMLSATINFLSKELGLSRIFMHEYETGRRLKKLQSTHPPTSLYTKLPKRFNFSLTDSAPEFIAIDEKIELDQSDQWWFLYITNDN